MSDYFNAFCGIYFSASNITHISYLYILTQLQVTHFTHFPCCNWGGVNFRVTVCLSLFIIIFFSTVIKAESYQNIWGTIQFQTTSPAIAAMHGPQCFRYWSLYDYTLWCRRCVAGWPMIRIPRNAVSRLPALFHKIEVNLWTWCSSLYHSWETTALLNANVTKLVKRQYQWWNWALLLWIFTKPRFYGSSTYSSWETELKWTLGWKLTSQETLKSISILFTENWIDLYSSRCMSDPNFMALALTVPKKHGWIR